MLLGKTKVDATWNTVTSGLGVALPRREDKWVAEIPAESAGIGPERTSLGGGDDARNCSIAAGSLDEANLICPTIDPLTINRMATGRTALYRRRRGPTRRLEAFVVSRAILKSRIRGWPRFSKPR